MNEQELSKLLYEAAEEVSVSVTASRRVLRRTRLRMAVTGTVALSFIALLAGGGFAVATRNAPGQPNLKPASPVVTPGPQEGYLSFSTTDGIILAEVEDEDSLWAFSAEERDDELCLYSTTHTEGAFGDVAPSGFGAASGIGDCGRLGVPQGRDVGFYMWDAENTNRLEVLGALSTDVARLELQESKASDDVVTIVEAPDELGDDRNFFYLWLPMKEVGTLVAYDADGNILEESPLCFMPGAQSVSCTIGEKSTTAGPIEASGPTISNVEYDRLACNNPWFGVIAKVEPQATPQDTVRAWIEERNIPVDIADFESKKRNQDVWSLSLPVEEGGTSVAAVLSRDGDRWGLAEVLYCPRLVDPDHRGARRLPPPPDHRRELRLPPPPRPPGAPPSPSP